MPDLPEKGWRQTLLTTIMPLLIIIQRLQNLSITVSLQPQGRSKTKCTSMKFLLPAFLLITVACFVSSQDIACPETDKKFKIGTSVEEVLGVPDWHACGKKFKIRFSFLQIFWYLDWLFSGEACGTQEKCQFWSFGPAKRIKINVCNLFTEQNELEDGATGWFSGAKDCK